MGIARRDFIKHAFALGGGAWIARPGIVRAASIREPDEQRWGMLVDTTLCIGCRRCEWACKNQNGLPHAPLADFDDPTVFERMRRPDAVAYTVVNRFSNPDDEERPIYVKAQCMHCEHAACVSACLVGALQKSKDGPVRYEAWKCIGCRYCMIACPFQIPAYEYHNALTPVVRKCTFCYERVIENDGIPACAAICPQGVMIFGTRTAVLDLARSRIREHPDRYVPRVYGEREVGGAAWMYLASAPFEELGFQRLGDTPVAGMNETVQHSLFKHFIPPALLYGLLGAFMWTFREKGAK